ncbi:hypothetical protein FANTH_13986 [Fusarium anthophilum]|uniref:Uncharacterized protein n=1 Tax=Fusarium anthophilum TaxID=48485 RepID=A0A8H5DNH4_9HYPO|nr:hypothetical protein FANTH_13986 [Fusarium anthophilum]
MDTHDALTPQATTASPTGVDLDRSASILSPSVDRKPSLQASIDILTEAIQSLSHSLPKPKPPILTWLDILLPIIQALTIFGGSITFTLIIGANARPTRRFTDQMVRDLLSVAWLLSALALAMATIAQLTVAGRDERIQARGDAKRLYTWVLLPPFLGYARLFRRWMAGYRYCSTG